MRKVWLGIIIVSLIGLWVMESGGFVFLGPKWSNATTSFNVGIPGADGLWNRAFEEAMARWNERTIFNLTGNDEIVRI